MATPAKPDRRARFRGDKPVEPAPRPAKKTTAKKTTAKKTTARKAKS